MLARGPSIRRFHSLGLDTLKFSVVLDYATAVALRWAARARSGQSQRYFGSIRYNPRPFRLLKRSCLRLKMNVENEAAIRESAIRESIGSYVDPYIALPLAQFARIESVHLSGARLAVALELPVPAALYANELGNALREHLANREIGTDLIYPVPLHLQKCYDHLGFVEGSFPVAEVAAKTCVSLPIFPELTDAQVDHVIASINEF